MTTTPDQEDGIERPSIATLFGQLVDDSCTFAQAEVAYIRAQVGERASYAVPGLAMIGAAVALSFGSIIALLIAAMLWLAKYMALGWAALIVTMLAALTCAILIRTGIARLRDSLKSRDAR